MPKPEHLHRHPACGACTRGGGRFQQPAMINGRCRLHGGKSTGPRTPEGLERARFARWKHGNRSASAVAARRALGQLIQAMNTELVVGLGETEEEEAVASVHCVLTRCELLEQRAKLDRGRADELKRRKGGDDAPQLPKRPTRQP